MIFKKAIFYGYNDAAHAHAVTHLGGVQKYGYDANGNQTKRIIGADTYDLAYDAENRLVEVKKNSSVYATFVYNADGQRVKSSVNGVSIGYIGSYAEWSSSSLTSYYYAGAAQIAMRQSGELIYMFGDDPSHSFGTSLGSTSKTYQVSNGETRMQLYTPWGERRYPTAASEISTRYRYTGQYEYSEFGLYFYQSRWYDATLGRFAQADTIVPNPGDSQSWDRYAYALNSPVMYVDPTGHDPIDDDWIEMFWLEYGRIPDNIDIKIKLFSLAYPKESSKYRFYDSDGKYNINIVRKVFQSPPDNRNWETLPDALRRLAFWYQNDEAEEFVRDLGSLFSSLGDRVYHPDIYEVIRNPDNEIFLFLNRQGLPPNLIDGDASGNIHHFGWALNLAWAVTIEQAILVNTCRELQTGGFNISSINIHDIYLGNRAAWLALDLKINGINPARIWLKTIEIILLQ